jgi:hypothetical protein
MIRVILISDLVASAHTGPDGELVFSTPPRPETLDRTMEAIRLCAEGILASGGTVQDVPIDSPEHSPPWSAEEAREIIAEAQRRGERGYIQVRGRREADP